MPKKTDHIPLREQIYGAETCATCPHRDGERCTLLPPTPGLGQVPDIARTREGWICAQHPVVQRRLQAHIAGAFPAPDADGDASTNRPKRSTTRRSSRKTGAE